MYRIRKYTPSDKEKLRFICKETTDEANKKNNALLESIAIIFNDYFTKYEPENIFVAVNDNDIPVGYVICSSSIELFRKKMLSEYAKQVWKIHPSSLPLLFATVIAVYITKKEYRTHLHIDLLPEAQRKGLGTKLIDALCTHLKSEGIKNVSVMTVSKKSMGYKFYCKYGFRIISTVLKNRVTMTYDIK